MLHTQVPQGPAGMTSLPTGSQDKPFLPWLNHFATVTRKVPKRAVLKHRFSFVIKELHRNNVTSYRDNYANAHGPLSSLYHSGVLGA